MCSIGEGDFGDEGAAHNMPMTEPISDTLNLDVICKKCNTDKVVLKLDAKEPQCRACFLSYVHHKFRASIGSSKVLPRDANVLLVVDGSDKSIVLLHMCRFALQLDRFRKLRFNPKILYLDEQPLVDTKTSERIIGILKSYSFEMFYQTLGHSADPIPISDQLNTQDATFQAGRQHFMETFNSLHSLTSKQDYLMQLRKRIWRSCARSLSCGIVFIAETNSDLANALLTDISLGRGGSAAHDVSFMDDRVQGVKLVRPIRDLNEKEVDHYLSLNELEYVSTIGLFGAENPAGASIQNLTSDFVKNLQKNYSSTITTVFRTGDKMAPMSNETVGQCKICHCTLDRDNSETLYAIQLSSYLSTNRPNVNGDSNVDVGTGINGGNAMEDTALCHACLSFSRDTSGAKEFILSFN